MPSTFTKAEEERISEHNAQHIHHSIRWKDFWAQRPSCSRNGVRSASLFFIDAVYVCGARQTSHRPQWDASRTGRVPHGTHAAQDASRAGRAPHAARPVRDASRTGRVPHGTRPTRDASRTGRVPNRTRPQEAERIAHRDDVVRASGGSKHEREH